ncbi:2-amino-4-hydroxy-6-hydroxymethyldihydropteridine diphosphokinase [Marinilabiliaceae bacterium JC017]|nr:2-amino-4-hydroxy-6-hydroxymethyldihydropteridine diphosphokinase [Marinilabiliaceae bacterium JC017]
MDQVILLLGGNLGDVNGTFQKAISLIEEFVGSIVKQSATYQSSAWGFDADELFLNQVIEVKTNLSPNEVLEITQGLEIELGRQTKTGTEYQSRPIDIDLLFFNDYIIETPVLTIPHPRLHQRKFTLMPLQDHWSLMLHPIFGKNMKELLMDCSDNGWVAVLD